MELRCVPLLVAAVAAWSLSKLALTFSLRDSSAGTSGPVAGYNDPSSRKPSSGEHAREASDHHRCHVWAGFDASRGQV